MKKNSSFFSQISTVQKLWNLSLSENIQKHLLFLFLGSKIKSSTLENNAELTPGYPPQYAVVFAPLKCKESLKYASGRCREIES